MELIKPLPEKVADYAGARVAAVAEYRAANPGVPMDEIRVKLASDGIHVYRAEGNYLDRLDEGFCCPPNSGFCCGPGSWCCAHAGEHSHLDETIEEARRG